MLDDRFEDQLRESAREYNAPPETPREEMWAAIQAKRAEGGDRGGRADRRWKDAYPLFPSVPYRSYRRLPLWPAAIAALLAIGIGLGRMSASRTRAGPAPAAIAGVPNRG